MSLVTYLNDDVMCRTQKYSFTFVSLLLRPSCLSWDFGGKGRHFPLSVNCCVLSFDKFCYTRIQVSVKDLDPSILLQSLNECKKEIERYRHESWMSSGLWLHGLFVSETEFPIYTSSFQAAFYVLMLPLFYLCLFIVSGISCYKSCHKSSLEALKVFVLEQS